jgi:hypothetical protein
MASWAISLRPHTLHYELKASYTSSCCLNYTSTHQRRSARPHYYYCCYYHMNFTTARICTSALARQHRKHEYTRLPEPQHPPNTRCPFTTAFNTCWGSGSLVSVYYSFNCQSLSIHQTQDVRLLQLLASGLIHYTISLRPHTHPPNTRRPFTTAFNTWIY